MLLAARNILKSWLLVLALAHMKEFPDYYERLARMEAEAERDWSTRRS